MTSEHEKMLAGQMYNALDPELVLARRRARDLCQALNATSEIQTDERAAILRDLIGSASEGAWIEPPFYCDYGSNITLGRKVFFNFNCVILDVASVTIGDFCLFGPSVQIYTATHPMSVRERRSGLEYAKPIEIGSDVWVGGGAIICPGVTIGAGAVIGAGSVVTRNIPALVLAAGNPCRVIRELDHE